jgi:predicted nucleotidyltransferase
MNSDFKELLNLFNTNGVKYLIIGGYAVIEYTEPRYTKDLDIWISAEKENATVVFQSLREFGAPLSGITADDFANEELFYQMGRPPGRVDILMSIPGVNFSDAWSRRVETDFEGVKVPLISRQDLIAAKIASGRTEDKRDVKALKQAELLNARQAPEDDASKKKRTARKQRKGR